MALPHDLPHLLDNIRVLRCHIRALTRVGDQIVQLHIAVALCRLLEKPFPLSYAYGNPALGAGEFPVQIRVLLLFVVLSQQDRGK